ncbi:excisionase family DNA-binding protein [Streptomyces sp. AK02-01A]|uniref:excisionase family DNA-binding protein n=1 Tax=Streptomyces sp. AK02-01A TaxID=3028648 RepID=UPI0029B6B19D|nr:excisionase family DNA-binding protein [Streptomyces sp. AK02-01A]MDX3852140.1 excisionase family DNA-binding protein [Streptomyces sp. AK02-01A]
MSVVQAAESLGVDDSRVRQLLHDGKLRGFRVGGRWLVEAASVQDRKMAAPEPGRPLSARNAWGALSMLSGCSPDGLSHPERSRLLARLRNLAADGDLATVRLQKLLAARAEVRRYSVHRGVLPVLLDDPDVVRAGVSAAPHVGADYIAPGRGEIYVHPERIGKLEAAFGLVRDAQRGNLVVRVPPASAWAFLVSGAREVNAGRNAPAPVVAADLLDAHEDRASVAAAGILEPLLASPPLSKAG